MRRLTRAPTTWPTSAILFQRLMRLESRPFEHSGSMATLEDWFDTRRRRKDYVPTGFVGVGVNGVVLKNRAVTGHPFGLRLPPADRRALIAFLRTLSSSSTLASCRSQSSVQLGELTERF